MTKKTFKYLNHQFQPLGRLEENFDFFIVTRQCRSIGISNYEGGDYSHSEFYKNAEKTGFGAMDIFLMDGKITVLPCQNELFEYSGKWDEVENVSQND